MVRKRRYVGKLTANAIFQRAGLKPPRVDYCVRLPEKLRRRHRAARICRDRKGFYFYT